MTFRNTCDTHCGNQYDPVAIPIPQTAATNDYFPTRKKIETTPAKSLSPENSTHDEE